MPSSGEHGALQEGVRRRQCPQVDTGHVGDITERLVGEEGLVGGDQHIGEGEQPGEQIVADLGVRIPMREGE